MQTDAAVIGKRDDCNQGVIAIGLQMLDQRFIERAPDAASLKFWVVVDGQLNGIPVRSPWMKLAGIAVADNLAINNTYEPGVLSR